MHKLEISQIIQEIKIVIFWSDIDSLVMIIYELWWLSISLIQFNNIIWK
jgi:hypothetical protein